jgi:serine protease
MAALSVALLTAALFAGSATGAGGRDPLAGQQQPLRIMHVNRALDRAGHLRDVKVLIADTGLDLDHPDLRGRLFALQRATKAPDSGGYYLGHPPTIPAGGHGWDLIGTNAPPTVTPDSDPSDPAGGSGHGTAVAGILGAARNNGKGGRGVAPNARFVALRSCWDGDQCYQYLQPDAFNWAADRGVRVVSLSWLADFDSSVKKSIANHPRVLFVTIPSGNGGAFNADPTHPFPCGLKLANVLCVSTSSPGGGLDCGAFGRHVVDVAVPTRGNVTTLNGGGFAQNTGCATSWAAPTAGGLATILFGMAPRASPAQVRRAIIAGARSSPAWKGKSVSGGIADALGAVEALRSELHRH